MSSYRGAGGPWDGGPPGAESDYETQRPQHYPQSSQPQQPQAMPATDPWTGVSYSQYSSHANYDYPVYGAGTYAYNYDSNYYNRSQEAYMNYGNTSARPSYPSQHSSYDYPTQPHSMSAINTTKYDSRQRLYKSNSRSVSPYERRERAYSKKRDSSYEKEGRRNRSRSKGKKSKRYSSSDRSSSRSSHLSQRRDKKKRRSDSFDSYNSDKSFKKRNRSSSRENSMTPPRKQRSSSPHRLQSRKISSDERSGNSPKSRSKDKLRQKYKDGKVYYKEGNVSNTPPRKDESKNSAKGYKKIDKMIIKKERLSVTPPKSYQRDETSRSSPRSKIKTETLSRKVRESTLTPPKSYVRKRSPSSSRSRSKSPFSKHSSYKHSHTPKSRRCRSISSPSQSSFSSERSRSKSRRRKSLSRTVSRSRSSSRRRSISKSRSKSRRRSKSKAKGRRSRSPREKSHSSRSKSKSRSGTPSDDERRGQFTVADRKRYWKLHRSKQEKREKEMKTPPKEVKPPPGAIEPTVADEIEYGDPPDVEGPNFAELLPPPDQTLLQSSSSSKSKTIPIPIKNDGSFLEMFKKMQEETKKVAVEEKKPEMKKPVLPFIGKRRGGKVLKTGLVKKAKAIEEQTVDNTPKDAWSLYMQEVKKYRETSCEEERKTRPLVK